MEDKQPINYIMALKLAMAKKRKITHPDNQDTESKKTAGRGPAVNNKPQKRVTGRGR